MIDDTLGMSVCGKDSVELNAFINSTIQSTKLYFNTLKCHKIHIGPRKDECPVLKVHGEEMKDSVAEKYLGDIVSAKGNDENIKSRRKTGFQAMSEMMSVLKEVAAGFYVSIGIILRDAILVSKLLLNSEVWHGLTVKQTDSLEQLDRIYLRNILRAHPKVGLECIYIDAGKLPLKYHIKFRRMMYLWQILHLEKTELVSRIFTSQKLEPKFGDWVKSVEKDKSDLLIDMDDSDIARQSKNKFRNYVKSKVKSLATHDLKEIKQKHSKSSKMELKNLVTAKYLKDPRLTKSEQQLLFSLRSRTFDVKKNFENQYKDVLCSTCRLFPETQEHLLQCPEIIKKFNVVNVKQSEVNADDIYSHIEKQIKIVKIFTFVLEIRKQLMNKEDLQLDS